MPAAIHDKVIRSLGGLCYLVGLDSQMSSLLSVPYLNNRLRCWQLLLKIRLDNCKNALRLFNFLYMVDQNPHPHISDR